MYIRYEPNAKHAKQNAEISQDLDVFEDAGYILNENDLIIDIDDLPKHKIEKLIKTFNIKTHTVWTDRGAHFYFKKPDGFRGAQGVCGLGFNVEYKHIKNTKSITVKRNGVARKVENEGFRESFPEFFKKGKYENLLGLVDGDGRNQKLFAHRMSIASLPNWKLIVQFINEVVFDEPLPDKEMVEITREMAVEAVKDGENIIADMIMREKRVVMYSNVLYFHDGKQFIGDEVKLNRMVYSYCHNQKSHYAKEIIEQMMMRSKLIDPETEFDIKLKNGLLRDGKFLEVEFTGFTPYQIDIEYKPDAKPVKQVDDYINKLTNNDTDYRLRLMECLGHTLITNKELKRLLAKFFIFVGDGGNGKGTLLEIIREILDPKNCSSLSIKNMMDERYLNTMKGKLANLGDDIQDEPINNEQMKMLKNISTCDRIELRKLYEGAKSTSLSTSLIFTSNHILKSFEKGTAYKRRVDWLPMYTKPTKKDPLFITKLTTKEALEYWLRLIIEGYHRLYKNHKFTHSEIVAEFNERYHEGNNTALGYIREMQPEDILGKRAPEVYEPYEIWCEENGENVQSVKQFKDTIDEVFGFHIKPKKINGKTQRVYVERED